MNQRKKEVLVALCILRRCVNERVFRFQHAADCICDESKEIVSWSDEGQVLDFITKAVMEKIEREEVKT